MPSKGRLWSGVALTASLRVFRANRFSHYQKTFANALNEMKMKTVADFISITSKSIEN